MFAIRRITASEYAVVYSHMLLHLRTAARRCSSAQSARSTSTSSNAAIAARPVGSSPAQEMGSALSQSRLGFAALSCLQILRFGAKPSFPHLGNGPRVVVPKHEVGEMRSASLQ